MIFSGNVQLKHVKETNTYFFTVKIFDSMLKQFISAKAAIMTRIQMIGSICVTVSCAMHRVCFVHDSFHHRDKEKFDGFCEQDQVHPPDSGTVHYNDKDENISSWVISSLDAYNRKNRNQWTWFRRL